MTLSGFAPVVSRRIVVALGFVAMMGAASMAYAQAAPPAPAADPFKFATDAGGIIWLIKQDKTADFESVWAAVRAKMAASDKPDMKALNDSLRIYKVDAPGAAPDSPVTYLFITDPASKTTSLELSPFLLFSAGLFERAEADKLFTQVGATIANINPLPLKPIK